MCRIKKDYFKISFIAIFIAIIGMISACEGPQGPAGADGKDGQDGKDGASGTAVCNDCHGENAEVWEKVNEYNNSGHASGQSWARGSSSSCAPCHSGQGFKLAATDKEVVAPKYPTPVQCISCHAIHSTYTESDLAPITVKPITFAGEFTNGATADNGSGNLCMNCHQTRNKGYFDTPGDIAVTSPYFGPHHGTQGNVLHGNGFYDEFPDFSASNSFHTTGIKDGCITCHMNEGDHSWHPSIQSCNKCHGSLEDFDYNNVQTDMKVLLDQLRDALVNQGLLEKTQDPEGNDIYKIVTSPDPVKRDWVGALFNYQGMKDDGSFGVHNTAYTRAVLKASIKALQD